MAFFRHFLGEEKMGIGLSYTQKQMQTASVTVVDGGSHAEFRTLSDNQSLK